jgi:transketolase
LGPQGDVLGVDTYGESAPAGAVFEHFGFTVENVLARLRRLGER